MLERYTKGDLLRTIEFIHYHNPRLPFLSALRCTALLEVPQRDGTVAHMSALLASSHTRRSSNAKTFLFAHFPLKKVLQFLFDSGTALESE